MNTRFSIKREPDSKPTSMRTCWLVCGCLLLLSGFGCADTRNRKTASQLFPDTPTAELFRDLRLLQDMDSGNLESARQKLEDDSMTRVLTILEGVGFTTNKEALYNEPGLRAVVKYWGHTKLPSSALIFQSPETSNYVYRAIGIVRAEYERRQESLNAK